ncbi:MAG: membrane bound O-acyl transferase family-domain-containing protein, partial [Saprospiraceae bacterium]|nr:membrane bound O-acyl transferase family-domain-containing protein [Saprospiraceae bacterium]
FLPDQPESLTTALVILLIVFLSGSFFLRIRRTSLARGAGWLLALIVMPLVHFLLSDAPAGFRMLALIVVLFQLMKNLCAIEHRNRQWSFSKWVLFSFGWVGMNPVPLFRRGNRPLPSWSLDMMTGVSRIAIGVAVIWGLRMLAPQSPGTGIQSALVALTLLVALSLVLHFGMLRINTAVLRYLGYPVPVLFKRPYLSRSLREFWGRRWNIPFVEMTSSIVYRPLRRYLPVTIALFATFLFSGLLHEIAISVSVKACYGLPLIYFLIQALAMLLEDHFKFRGSLWVLAMLLPLPILFHTPFMQEIVWPILGPGF